jgi:hypothetical protein
LWSIFTQNEIGIHPKAYPYFVINQKLILRCDWNWINANFLTVFASALKGDNAIN